MEHKLTVITLALNYSALTSQHLHSRHLRESKGVRFLQLRTSIAKWGNRRGWGGLILLYCMQLVCKKKALSTELEPREVIVK